MLNFTLTGKVNYFAGLRRELKKYLEPDQIESIRQAYLLARKAHQGQKRLSGEAYISHPVAVAMILAGMRMDYQSIMAGLLHDVIEDTPVSKQDLAEQFDESIAELVDGASKLTQISFETRAEAQAENLRKMILAMVRDIRVILVKLADRLHNMRTLSVLPPKKKRRIAIETLEIYAPIANRLGMHQFYRELEDLGFMALYPMRYRIVYEAVKKARGNRKEIMRRIEHGLTEAIKQHGIKTIAIHGRQKHLYSIYKKMRDKHSSFSEIMDVYGVRITCDKVDTCYRTLGVVHQLYKPVPERFKDYIAIPKANSYQSLHTTLFGPYGVPIEIQIRTEEMDKIAENGIAAHWLYKSGGLEIDEAQLQAREWMKDLLEMQQSTGNSLEFIENVKIDLFPDEVYVFTPQGHIMKLPRGATPVDFAYMVHSDVGNTCVAAKVNRRLAPLSEALSNGQTVEIITVPGARPNLAWLNFVVTGKARSNIRHFLKSQQTEEAATLGERLLDKALNDLSTGLSSIPEQRTDELVEELHYQSFKELCEAIGLGNQVAMVIARRLLQKDEGGRGTQDDVQCPLTIKGTEGMVLHYAECCRPIPGDPIVGYLKSGRGVLVHVENCRNVVDFHSKPEKFINMCWQDKVEGDFKVDIVVESSNRRGVLAQLTSAVSLAEANIENIQGSQRDQESIVHLTISVRDRIHLARVMRRLRRNKFVHRIYRKH